MGQSFVCYWIFRAWNSLSVLFSVAASGKFPAYQTEQKKISTHYGKTTAHFGELLCQRKITKAAETGMTDQPKREAP